MVRTIRFKDFVTLQRGFDLPRQNREAGDYPVVSASGIHGHHSEFKVPPPGVVTGRSGSLGSVFYVNQPFWPLNTTLWIKDFKNNLPRYVYYLLQTLDLIRYNSGVGVPTLNRNHLDNLEIAVHPIGDQQKVASILSPYDDLIENNLHRINILEEMAQLLYREWFINFRFPGHEESKMVDSPLGKIPAGWPVRPLTELTETQYGYTETTRDDPVGPRYLRGTDINKNSYISWSEVPYCPIGPDDLPKYKLNIGDIVVIRMADPGKVGIFEADVNAVFASYLVRVKINAESLTPYYLFHFLLSEKYQGYISGASTGTTRKSASAGVITGIDIIVPPLSLLQAFEKECGFLRKQLTQLLKQNAVLRQTRDLLLHKLISGQIDVSDLNIKISEDLK